MKPMIADRPVTLKIDMDRTAVDSCWPPRRPTNDTPTAELTKPARLVSCGGARCRVGVGAGVAGWAGGRVGGFCGWSP